MKKKTARKSLIIMLAIVITIAMMPTMAFATANGGGADMWRQPYMDIC